MHKIVPGQFVLVDQFIDRTKGVRDVTFFEKGIVAHVGFSQPTCTVRITSKTLKKEEEKAEEQEQEQEEEEEENKKKNKKNKNEKINKSKTEQ